MNSSAEAGVFFNLAQQYVYSCNTGGYMAISAELPKSRPSRGCLRDLSISS